MADHFLSHLSSQYEKKSLEIDEDALKKLSSYSWPGNVRELRNVIERLVILSESDKITKKDVDKFSGK